MCTYKLVKSKIEYTTLEGGGRIGDIICLAFSYFYGKRVEVKI